MTTTTMTEPAMTKPAMTRHAADFWDRIAPKYAKDPIADMPAYEYTLGRTISYLDPTHRVLELGAGTGSTALRLAPHLREIVSTDVSPAMMGIAERRKAEAGPDNARFEAASVAEALQIEGPFDAVLAFNLFHLVPDMERRFVEIADGLPQGGLFISKTPCLSDPVQGVMRFAFRIAIPLMKLVGKAPYVRFFTQADLEAALDRAGFDIVEAGNFPARARYVVARKR